LAFETEDKIAKFLVGNRCQHVFCYNCSTPYYGPSGIFAVGNAAHLESCAHYRGFSIQGSLRGRVSEDLREITSGAGTAQYRDQLGELERRDTLAEQRQNQGAMRTFTSDSPIGSLDINRSLAVARGRRPAEMRAMIREFVSRRRRPGDHSPGTRDERRHSTRTPTQIQQRGNMSSQTPHTGSATRHPRELRDSDQVQSSREPHGALSDPARALADTRAQFDRRESTMLGLPTRRASNGNPDTTLSNDSLRARLALLRARFDELQKEAVHEGSDNRRLEHARALLQEQRVTILEQSSQSPHPGSDITAHTALGQPQERSRPQLRTPLDPYTVAFGQDTWWAPGEDSAESLPPRNSAQGSRTGKGI
jgi:hypothetical protein